MSIGDTLGTVTVEMIDNGTPRATPRVTCPSVGRITSGWFDNHVPFIEQEIERAQSRARLALTQSAAPAEAAPVQRRRR